MSTRPSSPCRSLFPALIGLAVVWSAPLAVAVNVTIHADTHRSIGGVGDLDRTKYFNHWGTHVIQGNTNLGDLTDPVWEADGLHSVTGRETFEFDFYGASGAAQDTARPGYFDLDALRGRMQNPNWNYRNHVNNSQRYESIREQTNPLIVQSGRANGSWPSWLKAGTTMPISHQGRAYAEFLNVWLEEVVHGTGPNQGWYPVAPENFYLEIMNEPQLELYSGASWNDVIEMHKNVTIAVKEAFPTQKIGGASVGEAPLQPWNPHRWDFAKQMMDDMTTWRDSQNNPVEFDFWTFHPYDVIRVRNNGVIEQQLNESTGHLEGIMDLFESYSHQKFGDPKQFAVTEYGATIYTENGSQDFQGYTRARRQWDEMRDVKEKMLVFMDRPDRIINATPFLAPQWFTGSTPTEENGAHYAFWTRDDNSGDWTETIAAGLYRMMNGVQGHYVPIDSNDDDIQTVAFRDGNRLHILLNNLNSANRAINLQAIVGDASVTGATLGRVFWDGSTGVYQDDLDVTGSWQSLNLTGEEGAVLTLDLAGRQLYNIAYDERTYYGDKVQTPINLSGGRSEAVFIAADNRDAASARVRIAIADRNNIWNESFVVYVNGHAITVPARGGNGFDDGDSWLFSREVDVPVEYLNFGSNAVYVDFANNGGQLVTATLLVTHTIGDYNGNELFDAGDLDALFANFGVTPIGGRFDLVGEDGIVDDQDIDYWLNTLRGTVRGDADLDGLVSQADLDAVLLNWGETTGTGWATGDLDGDGFVSQADLDAVLLGWGDGAVSAAPAGTLIPEPTAGLMLACGGMSLLRRRRVCARQPASTDITFNEVSW